MKIIYILGTGYGEIKLVLNRKLHFLTSFCSARGCCVGLLGTWGGVINSQQSYLAMNPVRYNDDW